MTLSRDQIQGMRMKTWSEDETEGVPLSAFVKTW